MTLVNVLLDLPVLDPPPIYSYTVTEDQQQQAAMGRRVLVEMGKNKMEGWILSHSQDIPAGVQAKPILRILGDQPEFNQSTWELAQWVAETFLCPVNITLKAMLPPGSGRAKPELIIPTGKMAVREGYPDDFADDQKDFISRLLEEGHMEWKEALHFIERGQLEEMRSRGLIKMVRGRRTTRRDGKEWISVSEVFDAFTQLPILRKRAPRQAQAMEYLMGLQQCKGQKMERQFGRKAVLSLIEKGYIIRHSGHIDINDPQYTLTEDQDFCLQELIKAARGKRNEEYLLFGITGSGKTEIYLRLAQQVIADGQSVLVLVPEIALTRHLTKVFTERIPRLAVLHSSMTMGDRIQTFKRISEGEVDLVLGTRLAVFAPLPDLGLIILDEEQENTFKQEESPRYHTGQVARFRTQREEALLVLGSATPSLETFYRAAQGQVKVLRLNQRVGDASLPRVIVEDLRKLTTAKRYDILSPFLMKCLQDQLDQGRQSILFINRRGHSPYTLCRSCGKVLSCPNCSVALSYHRSSNENICHYCDHHSGPVSICPVCGSRALQLQGAGTERVEEEIRLLFPEARVERLDTDSSRRRGRQEEILDMMQSGQVDILIGTQMVAKGLDFPQVSLVGIVDADSMISLPDFRAGERGFQLMVQAAGRAGRGPVAGQVVIQTYNPDHYVIQGAASQDYEGFFAQEIKWRELLQYPPCTHLLRIVVSGENERAASLTAQKIKDAIDEALDAQEDLPVILGPAPCPLARLHKRFRFQILLKSPNLLLLSSIGRYIINRERKADERLEVDIDPLVTM